MRTADLLPIPNFGDPAGCVAITGGPAPDMVLDSSSRGSTEIADVQKPEICSVEFRGQKSLEALPGSCASTADATAWRSSAGVASCPRETNTPEASGTARKAPGGPLFGGPSRYAPEVRTVGVKHPDMTARETGRGEAEHSLRLPSFDGSTAVRVFGPGDVLAKLETELAGFVAGLNARDRLMRRHRLDYDDPPPLFLTEQRDDRDHGHGQSIRRDTGSILSAILRVLSGRVLLPIREGLRP